MLDTDGEVRICWIQMVRSQHRIKMSQKKMQRSSLLVGGRN